MFKSIARLFASAPRTPALRVTGFSGGHGLQVTFSDGSVVTGHQDHPQAWLPSELRSEGLQDSFRIASVRYLCARLTVAQAQAIYVFHKRTQDPYYYAI